MKLPAGKIPIPAVRSLLTRIADASESGTITGQQVALLIRALLPHLCRERTAAIPGTRRAAHPVTPEAIEQVRALKSARPELTSYEIANTLHLNPGRVSEILRGLWDG
jgi:hypothetical protein